MRNTFLVLAISLALLPPALCAAQVAPVQTFETSILKVDVSKFPAVPDNWATNLPGDLSKYLPAVPADNVLCQRKLFATYVFLRNKSFGMLHKSAASVKYNNTVIAAMIRKRPTDIYHVLHALDRCPNLPFLKMTGIAQQWKKNRMANERIAHAHLSSLRPKYIKMVAEAFREAALKEAEAANQRRIETTLFLKARSAYAEAIRLATPKVRKLLRCRSGVNNELLWALVMEASKYCGMKVGLKDVKFEMRKVRQYAKRHGVYSKRDVYDLSKNIRYYEEAMRDISQGIRSEGCKLKRIPCNKLDVVLNAIPEVPRPRPPRDLRTYKDGRNQDYINRQHRLRR